jgi:hypothetical protein
MFQSPELTALVDALAILSTARLEVAGNVSFAWNLLRDAGDHLQAQVTAHFSGVDDVC